MIEAGHRGAAPRDAFFLPGEKDVFSHTCPLGLLRVPFRSSGVQGKCVEYSGCLPINQVASVYVGITY